MAVIAADVTDPTVARRVCERATIVFHCASGPYGRWSQTLPPIMNGIIEGAAAAGASPVHKLFWSVPNRTSYELDLPAEMPAWYSAVQL